MENIDIREMIEKKRIRHYEVAKEIGICEAQLSRWLRYPLSDTRRRRVLEALKNIK